MLKVSRRDPIGSSEGDLWRHYSEDPIVGKIIREVNQKFMDNRIQQIFQRLTTKENTNVQQREEGAS